MPENPGHVGRTQCRSAVHRERTIAVDALENSRTAEPRGAQLEPQPPTNAVTYGAARLKLRPCHLNRARERLTPRRRQRCTGAHHIAELVFTRPRRVQHLARHVQTPGPPVSAEVL